MAANFAEVVQYDNVTYTFEIPNVLNVLTLGLINFFLKFKDPKMKISNFCEIMMNASIGDLLTRYALINTLVLNFNGFNCLNVSYIGMIESYKNETFDKKNNGGTYYWILSKI